MSMIPSITPHQLNDYLWHGYIPPQQIPEWLWAHLPRRPTDEPYTPAYASLLLDNLFDRLCDRCEGQHIVPISGGFDSRLILAALKERVGGSAIRTVSYGCPGQLDFDIGGRIARHAGVRHQSINLREVSIGWQQLVQSVRRSPWTYVPNPLFDSVAHNWASAGNADWLWIGFMGDPLTGGHLPKLTQDTPLAQWQRHFADKERFARRVRLTMPEYQPVYPAVPDHREAPFVTTEWYDFAIRQVGCIAPLFLPGGRWDGWKTCHGRNSAGDSVITPFCDPEWASYWLHVPRELHRNQTLYLHMARSKYPTLFSMPTKGSFGVSPKKRVRYIARRYRHSALKKIQDRAPWSRVQSSLMHNYIDFDEAFRRRKDYRNVLETAIDYLQQNDVVPWVDVKDIAEAHFRRRANHGKELLVLLGLAVNLYAEEQDGSSSNSIGEDTPTP